ncbi:HU family DNA-binding protein [Sedimentitalea arenosa]|jgi:DNA-binding protein HU-alpha|nr:HU family DNA-binding protein [Arenibacterium arenosum]
MTDPADPMSTQKTAAEMPAVPEDALSGVQMMKKKDLIDQVVTRSGIKKKSAKPVVEAVLAVLGETIASGREFNLPPMGKLSINRSIDKSNARVTVCKLRQNTGRSGAKEPLAEPEE